MSGRQKTKRSPAHRHGKAEAAVAKTPAPPTPEQLQQIKQLAVRQVMAEMQAEIDHAIAEEQEEWRRDTGRPMPMGARQLVIEARFAGISREDIAQAEERAQKTGDRFGYDEVKLESTVAKIRRDQHIADEITVRTATATPCTSPKEDKRLGAPEHEDNELEKFLFDSWTTYSNDPNLVDRPVKSDWLQALPDIRDEQNLTKKRQLTKRYKRLLRNTLKRHAHRKRKLEPQTPRTK